MTPVLPGDRVAKLNIQVFPCTRLSETTRPLARPQGNYFAEVHLSPGSMRRRPNISLSAISCVNFGISFLEAETTSCRTTQEGSSAEIWVIAPSFQFYSYGWEEFQLLDSIYTGFTGHAPVYLLCQAASSCLLRTHQLSGGEEEIEILHQDAHRPHPRASAALRSGICGGRAESSKLIVLFQRPVWGYFMCYPAGSSHQKDISCGHRWDWEGQRQYSGRPDDVQLVLEEIPKWHQQRSSTSSQNCHHKHDGSTFSSSNSKRCSRNQDPNLLLPSYLVSSIKV